MRRLLLPIKLAEINSMAFLGGESKLWQYVRDGMGNRWDAQRIEDSLSVGIPDISYCITVNGWIELKHVPKAPIKSETVMKIKHWTAEQENWLITRGKRGGSCFVLIQIENCYLLIDWSECHLIGKVNFTQLCDAAIRVWHSRINWEELTKLLS